jgi:hypothetical protein
MGAAAEYIALSVDLVTALPDDVSVAEGATLGIPAMTAHRVAGPVQGKTLLVTGGAGAVGHYAVQLANWAGATVITTVSSDEQAERATVALAVVEPYALAEPTLVHAGPDLIDDPGAVAVSDDSRVLHCRRTAAPVGIRRIDTGRLQLHPYLAVTCLRRRQLALDQNLLRRSLPVIPNRAHDPLQ